MELYKVKDILASYFEGKSTVEEETMLRNYFSGDNVASELKSYQVMFAYFKEAQNDAPITKTSSSGKNEVKPLQIRYTGLAIAATIAIILGVFMFTPVSPKNDDLGTYDDPEIALQKTKEVLQLVSKYMNEGTSDLEYLNEIRSTKEKFLK
ncbi:hypothetical protein ACE939_07615 [Aquimarina sp. W85]|uniref:hypothetical protein n=1 Tax=Aquimarina rhodophyticola TaxID=3342246 RepID=UPI00366D7F73